MKTKLAKLPAPSEHVEQSMLFQWAARAQNQYPDLRWMYAVPNGSNRSMAHALYMKREGLKSGVPDICLPVAKGGYHGLYIEMKRKPNKSTPEQDAWATALMERGYYHALCWNFEEAKEQILGYLKP